MCIGEPDQVAATGSSSSSSRWPLCPGPRTSSTRPPSSWPTRRSWVWRRRWRRTSWRTTSSTSSPTYSLARPSPWRNLSSCRKSNLFHLFQGRDGDLPLLVHGRAFHDHPDYSLQPLLPRCLAWGSTAGVWWDCWTGGHNGDDGEDYPHDGDGDEKDYAHDGDDYDKGFDQWSWWWWISTALPPGPAWWYRVIFQVSDDQPITADTLARFSFFALYLNIQMLHCMCYDYSSKYCLLLFYHQRSLLQMVMCWFARVLTPQALN